MPGSAEALVNSCGKIKHLLIVYFLNNISAKGRLVNSASFSAVTLFIGRQDADTVICLGRGANDLHMAQQMPLPLTVSCFSKIQIGSVPSHPGNPRQSPEGHKIDVCVCMRACVHACHLVNCFETQCSFRRTQDTHCCSAVLNATLLLSHHNGRNFSSQNCYCYYAVSFSFSLVFHKLLHKLGQTLRGN